MKKLIEFLLSKIKYIILIYVLIQLVLIFATEITYNSDCQYYYQLAQDCIEQGEFYPAQNHLYEDYIFAPLYINVILVLLKIYNSHITISLFNFLIILVQILVLYKISLKVFSENVAALSVLLYIFYLNNLGFVLLNYTELLFVFLVSLSIYFFLLNKNYAFLLSGIFLGSSIAVRPTGWVLLAAFIILQMYVSYKNRKPATSYLYIYTGVLIFILCFGGWTYSHFGKFEFTSTTGPVNLLIGANDDATGGFNGTVHQKGKIGYIENPENLTYTKKSDFYLEEAVKWIQENPIKWISLVPLKMLHAFAWDDITVSPLLGYHNLNFGRAVRNIFDQNSSLVNAEKVSGTTSVFYFFIQAIHHLYYYFLLVAIVLGIYQLIKNKNFNDGTRLILLYSLFSIFVIMIIFGTPRFKYPMFILLLPLAANYLTAKLKISEKRIEQS